MRHRVARAEAGLDSRAEIAVAWDCLKMPYNEQNAEITVLVNPARARVVHIGKRNVVVPRNGMPDVSVNGLTEVRAG